MAFTKSTTTMSPTGTVRWMALELFNSDPARHTMATDVWSFGMVTLGALAQEVLRYGRPLLRNRGHWIIYDAIHHFKCISDFCSVVEFGSQIRENKLTRRAVGNLGVSYGGRPVRSSITVHPREQMSLARDAPLSSMTSGATIKSHKSPTFTTTKMKNRGIYSNSECP